MEFNQQQYLATTQQAFGNWLSLSQKALNNTERLAKLNLDSARLAVQQFNEASTTLLNGKDLSEALNKHAVLSRPAMEAAASYGRDLCSIASDSKDDLITFSENTMSEVSKLVEESLNELTKTVPEGAEAAITAARSAASLTSQGFEAASKAVRQIDSIAAAGFSAMTEATLKAAEATPAAPQKTSSRKKAELAE